MKKSAKAAQSGARKRARSRSKAITWIIGLAIVGAIGYGLANVSGIAYDEDDIKAVRFDLLNDDQKEAALIEANTARCTCGCGMTLAQCVATDSTCPLRVGNIDRIKGMVAQAHTP